MGLIDELLVINDYPDVVARRVGPQGTSSFYPRRRPEDSWLDADKWKRCLMMLILKIGLLVCIYLLFGSIIN